MIYKPVPYWRARGERFVAQEAAFVDLISGLTAGSVLDVGCGPGRLGTLVHGVFPDVLYTGIDVSPAVLRMAAVRLPHAEFHEASLFDFETDRRFDLVVASELLMHVPPAALDDAVARLAALSRRWVLTIDWTEPITDATASHNFLHDYRAAFAGLRLIEARSVGVQTLHLSRAA